MNMSPGQLPGDSKARVTCVFCRPPSSCPPTPPGAITTLSQHCLRPQMMEPAAELQLLLNFHGEQGSTALGHCVVNKMGRKHILYRQAECWRGGGWRGTGTHCCTDEHSLRKVHSSSCCPALTCFQSWSVWRNITGSCKRIEEVGLSEEVSSGGHRSCVLSLLLLPSSAGRGSASPPACLATTFPIPWSAGALQ